MRYYFIIILLLLLIVFSITSPKQGFETNLPNYKTGSKKDTLSKKYNEIPMKLDSNKYSSANYSNYKDDGSVKEKTDLQPNVIFYEPGSFLYSSKNYVPDYEKSVYLSNAKDNSLSRSIYS